MDDVKELYEFWKQESPEGNRFPTQPANPRSATIQTAMTALMDPTMSVLEVGCNVGRNMNHLAEMGYTNVAGIEINQHAVDRLRIDYNTTLGNATVYIGTAEEQLQDIPDNAYDVVFTMAVLEHIHPSSVEVYKQIARVAKHFVLAIEPRHTEAHDSHRQHPWDVPKEYAQHGMHLIRTVCWSDLWRSPKLPANNWHPVFDRYDANVFAFSPAATESAGSTDVAKLQADIKTLEQAVEYFSAKARS